MAIVIWIMLCVLTVVLGYGLFVLGIKLNIWTCIWLAISMAMMMLGFFTAYNKKQIYNDYDRIQYQISTNLNAKNLCVYGSITDIQVKEFNYRVALKTKEGIVHIDVENVENLIPGMKIRVKGEVKTMGRADNPGGYDEYMYLRSNGVLLKIKSLYEDIDIIDQCKSVNIQGCLYKIKLRISNMLRKICTEDEYGLLAAMVISDKTDIDKSTKELYSMQGIAHVLAISGVHISIIGIGIYKILRRKMWYLSSAVVSGLVMIGFSIMTGNSISAVRAVIMFLLHIFGDVCGRKYDMLSALSLSAILLLLDNPYYMRNVSFLLSYIAMIAVTITGPVVTEFVRSKNNIIKTLLFNLSLSFTSMPVNASIFYRLSTYSVLLNLIVVPLMGIVLAMSILGIIVGFIAEPLGVFFIGTAVYILRLYKMLAIWTGKLPLSTVVTGNIEWTGIMVYYGCLIFVLLLMKYGCRILCKISWKKHALTKYASRVVVTSVVAILLLVMCFIVYGKKQSQFVICFMDVGQGDCTYIRSQEGVDYLIDGGSTDEKNIGEYKIESMLEYMDVDKLEYVFVSHCDNDHISGIVELLERGYIGIDNLVLPAAAISFNNDNTINLISLAKSKGVNIIYLKKGDMLYDGDMKIYCASPFSDKSYTDINEASMVLLVEYNNLCSVFTGDIGIETEQDILEDVRYQLNVMKNANKMKKMKVILKVAHHGSQFSTSEEWLNVLKPDVAIISCGEDNSYGHPHRATLDRLNNVCSSIYTTFNNGAIIINRNNITVTLTQ